ncbi:MAG TPA: hypothetical protein VJ724_00935 [Tahibacter sp.]|nr:hypothetical protein [Tahibacter sp.]
MKANVTMKALSAAVLGLAGMAFAGSSMAACPATATAWTATVATGGAVTIATPGYKSTECRADSAITANLGSASAFVRDDTPNNEARYRTRFLINVDNLTGLNSTQPVRIFSATTATPAMSVPEVVRLSVFGNAAGTNKVLGIATACSSSATGLCSFTAPLTGGTAGVHTIEIDWQKGTTGSIRVWVNNGTEASPTLNQTVDNNAWGGVDSAALGLSSASAGFRSAQLNRTVGFDEFDSRRSTFIGL